MKNLTKLLKIIIFAAGFIYALSLFIDWQTVGKFAISAAHSRLESRGVRLNYSDVSGTEDGFTLHNLRLSGLIESSMTSITIKPQFVQSLLNLGIVCEITFRGANVRFGQFMNFGDGGFDMQITRSGILLDNLHTNGDFAITGYITLDTANMSLGQSEARFEISDNGLANMNMLSTFLPLVKEGDRWYLRHE